MSYTEGSLKALTVVKLKDILAKHSLPVTGKKDDLVARILAANVSESDNSSSPTPLDPTANSTDEPDGDGLNRNSELTSATIEPPQTANPDDAPQVAPTPASQPQPQPQQPELTEQEQRQATEQALKQEEEKRKARLARFGGGGTEPETTATSETDDQKRKRAERFGLEIDQPVGQDQQTKLHKSLELLDKPLGSNRRERKPKSDKAVAAADAAEPTSKSNPVGERTVAQKTRNPAAAAEPAAAAAAADPELQKRLAEDEEKKKKRAARFGAPPSGATEPQEKKTKTD